MKFLYEQLKLTVTQKFTRKKNYIISKYFNPCKPQPVFDCVP